MKYTIDIDELMGTAHRLKKDGKFSEFTGNHDKEIIYDDLTDYRHRILPPLPSFLPMYAKEITTHRQCIYQ